MAFQHKNLLVSEKEIKSDNRYIIKNENSGEMAYFAIVDNRKLGEYYLEAGATGILVGGQTQNPSVHDIEEGIKKGKQELLERLIQKKLVKGKSISEIAEELEEEEEKEPVSPLAGINLLKQETFPSSLA